MPAGALWLFASLCHKRAKLYLKQQKSRFCQCLFKLISFSNALSLLAAHTFPSNSVSSVYCPKLTFDTSFISTSLFHNTFGMPLFFSLINLWETIEGTDILHRRPSSILRKCARTDTICGVNSRWRESTFSFSSRSHDQFVTVFSSSSISNWISFFLSSHFQCHLFLVLSSVVVTNWSHWYKGSKFYL